MDSLVKKEAALNIPVDTEHSALRFSILAIFVVVLVVAFYIANTLIASAGFNIIAGVIAFAAAGICARLAESYLKQKWPSGRELVIDASGIRMTSKGQPQITVNAAEPMSLMFWRFKIKRRTRVPKGWFVVACAVEQDDEYLTAYTLASPEQADTLNKLVNFVVLLPEKDAKGAGKQDSLRVAGEQRRLRTAESHRWEHGAEMTFPDFERFVTRITEQFAQWMPLNR
jgi:hypothetical protein